MFRADGADNVPFDDTEPTPNLVLCQCACLWALPAQKELRILMSVDRLAVLLDTSSSGRDGRSLHVLLITSDVNHRHCLPSCRQGGFPAMQCMSWRARLELHGCGAFKIRQWGAILYLTKVQHDSMPMTRD